MGAARHWPSSGPLSATVFSMPYKNREDRNAYQRRYYQKKDSLNASRRSRRWRAVNRVSYNVKQTTWRSAYPARQLLYYAKARAKKLGISFDLTEEDVVIPERCPVLGIVLRYGAKSPGNRQAAQDSPSLDRIEPNVGYVKGNVVVVSWRANSLKKDASVAELQALATFYGNLKFGR